MLSKRSASSPADKVLDAAAKRARLADERQTARQTGWRLVDKKSECFYPVADTLPKHEQYLQFNIRSSSSLSRFSIFRRFVNDNLMEQVRESWTPEQLRLQIREPEDDISQNAIFVADTSDSSEINWFATQAC